MSVVILWNTAVFPLMLMHEQLLQSMKMLLLNRHFRIVGKHWHAVVRKRNHRKLLLSILVQLTKFNNYLPAAGRRDSLPDRSLAAEQSRSSCGCHTG